ncbi:MAG: hypothetical protein AAF250_16255 [Pseudomonadota bacterium]
MTAEIAVINKTAIALAADSKVTLSQRGEEQKIFDAADKLFELSEHNPIGIMFYNNLQFMGVPIDVLVREFRSSLGPVDQV